MAWRGNHRAIYGLRLRSRAVITVRGRCADGVCGCSCMGEVYGSHISPPSCQVTCDMTANTVSPAPLIRTNSTANISVCLSVSDGKIYSNLFE